MNPEGVICAVDVNDYDEPLLELAVEFANFHGVDLDIVHVTDGPNANRTGWSGYLGPTSELVDEDAQLRSLLRSIDGATAHGHHLTGDPATELIAFARRNRPRLLILGTCGRQGLARVMGSVAARVLRQVECPVLVLRRKPLGLPPPD